MKDRWINAGFDEEALKPFVEPELDIKDQKRIGEILSALSQITLTVHAEEIVQRRVRCGTGHGPVLQIKMIRV